MSQSASAFIMNRLYQQLGVNSAAWASENTKKRVKIANGAIEWTNN